MALNVLLRKQKPPRGTNRSWWSEARRPLSNAYEPGWLTKSISASSRSSLGKGCAFSSLSSMSRWNWNKRGCSSPRREQICGSAWSSKIRTSNLLDLHTIGRTFPHLPDILHRPVPGPLGFSIRAVGARTANGWLRLDEVLNHETCLPEEPYPLAIGQLEIHLV